MSVSNKPAIQPDLTPKGRTTYLWKQVLFALLTLAIALAFSAAFFMGLGAKRENDLAIAIKAANTKEAQFIEGAKQLDLREKELDGRERALTLREQKLEQNQAALVTREEALALDRAAFETEKVDFGARTKRIRNLSTLLSEEIRAEFPIEEITEDIDLDGPDDLDELNDSE